MDDFNEWLLKQQEVYTRFRNSTIKIEGTRPNTPTKNTGGYLVAFRHPEEVREKISSFSRKIAETTPLLIYGKDVIHTSITDFSVMENFSPEPGILRSLCDIVRKFNNKQSPKIDYQQWLYNQNTIILEGTPNELFFNYGWDVKNSGGEKHIQLRLPWGAHITANRFKEEKNPEELRDFFKLMREAPVIGMTFPECIDVCTFSFDINGFELKTYERFNLY